MAKAQDRVIETVPNQPLSEAYDLLKDSKGYLWVAHDLGISRYDGSVFITLHNPLQSSVSMSGLIEDKKGRIWCHNFSGQIFYIENLQLHLLEEYKYEDEQGFPRITICGDELVATSVKGLFVYNLLTTKSNYYTVPNGTSSLTRVGNRVVCFNGYEFYSYEAGKPISKLCDDLHVPDDQFASLPNLRLKDTFYFIINPKGAYYKLTLDRNAVKIHEVNNTEAFINTISVHNEKVWINTKEHSYTTDGKAFIRGMNLSDITTDSRGNQWMSSLKKGLCVRYNAQLIKKLDNSFFEAEHPIRRMYTEGNTMFWGTTDGRLYKLSAPSSLEYVLAIPKQAGAIEQIASLDKDHLMLAASTGLYVYNRKTKALTQLPLNSAVKDIKVKDGKAYLATTLGIKLFPLASLNNRRPPAVTDITEVLPHKIVRCRSIAFTHDSLIAAYNNGVYIMRNGSFQQLLYKQRPIYATTIREVAGKIVIGTFNQGLLILENGVLKSITEREGLASNFVKDIKTISGITWLVYADRIQQLDQPLTGVADYAIPFPNEKINDFSVLANQLYITTSSGTYSLQVSKPASGITSTTYIDKITVNGNELVTTNKLKHFQNYLQFHVSTPFFSPYSKITYQYRIRNAPNTTWQQGTPGQSVFNLVALEPGVYTFEILAIDENRKVISKPAIYRFEIVPAWYQQWVFRLLAAVALSTLGLYFIWSHYRSRLRKQQSVYEQQLAVQAERQRISAEIHDDVGAGLSAIRLLTEITKEKLPESEAKQEVGKIHASISELSHKMREVIWSLNTENDYLENLLYYIRRQALVLFENSSINLKVVFPSHEIPAIAIKGEKRRHIYLSVKEALHNCLKHSGAQNCTLTMRVEGGILRITVTDDGRGFALSDTHHTGNGLTGMKRRMQQISGSFEVDVQERTSVQFMVPLNERT